MLYPGSVVHRQELVDLSGRLVRIGLEHHVREAGGVAQYLAVRCCAAYLGAFGADNLHIEDRRVSGQHWLQLPRWQADRNMVNHFQRGRRGLSP